jgi:hypothetical protein
MKITDPDGDTIEAVALIDNVEIEIVQQTHYGVMATVIIDNEQAKQFGRYLLTLGERESVE